MILLQVDKCCCCILPGPGFISLYYFKHYIRNHFIKQDSTGEKITTLRQRLSTWFQILIIICIEPTVLISSFMLLQRTEVRCYILTEA